MKKVFIVISILLLFTACTHEKNNSLNLFDDLTFKMQVGETSEDIKPIISDLYSSQFNNGQIQIPLFKYIRHSDYQIFIAIPLNTTIDKLAKTQLEEFDSGSVYFESGHDYFFIKCKRDGLYICEYAATFKKNTLIFVSLISVKKEISDSLFNKGQISKRIELKKDQ